jgi:hypothetical protein
MNRKQVLDYIEQTTNPEMLKASTDSAKRSLQITDLFIEAAGLDPVTATWITAISLEHFYQFLKTHPDTVNKYISDYMASQNG